MDKQADGMTLFNCKVGALRQTDRRVGVGIPVQFTRWALLCTIATVLGLALVVMRGEVVQGQAATPAQLTFQAPAQVEAGQVISLTLRLASPVTVGGFEAQFLFDPQAAEFAAFYPPAPTADAGLGRLLAPQLPGGSAVGFYACATVPCLEQRAVQVAAASAVTDQVAVVELLPLTPGVLEVTLGHLVVVDAAGHLLPVTLTPPTVTIQVGTASDAHPAPAGDPLGTAWSGQAQSAQAVSAAAADVTGSGGATHADVMEVALAWQLGREDGDPCGFGGEPVDLDGDGCVDVVDVQLAAAFAANPEPVQPEAPDQSEQSYRIYVPLIMGGGATGAESAQVAAGLTFVVNSTLDESDAKWGDGVCLSVSGVCTLRAAIAETNAQTGPNTIQFNIPGSGVHTIQLTSRLPTLHDESGPTVIDGYSQPGATPNTDPAAGNAQLRIEVRGNGSEQFDCLVITSAGNRVQGLAIYNCKRALWVYGAGAHDNALVGDFIGTDAAGGFRFTVTSAKQAHGLHIEQGAYGNRIGGVLPAERNVIGGNARHGIGFWHVGTNQNQVLNNMIGLAPNGLSSLSNRVHGIDLNYGASLNIVGGVEQGERNVISGNNGAGVEISHTGDTTQNEIMGNYIGTNLSGNQAPGFAANGGYGVSLKDRVVNNLVANNVVGNNRSGGVFVDNFGNCCTSDNVIEYNRIGIGVDGAAIGNTLFGISVQAPRTRIGPGNVVAYNPVGIQIYGSNSQGNTITQNSIFGNSDLGIDREPLAQANTSDPNLPVLQQASTSSVSGTTCANCVVEIFVADAGAGGYGEGRTFAGQGTAAADGSFAVAVTGVGGGDSVTATATDPVGNTTEFSLNLAVAGGQPWQQVFAIPGRIEAEDYLEGGEGAGYHDTTVGNSGRAYRNDDVDIEATQDSSGAYDVGWFAPGEWLAYDVNVANTGTYQVVVRVATPSGSRRFHLAIDGADVSGPITIPWTGGWQNWVDVTVSIPLTAGPHTFRFVAETDRFNVNYYDFSSTGN